MLVYGDRSRALDPAGLLAEIEHDLQGAGLLDDLARHDRLTRALIGAGELAQGLADYEMARAGCDDFTPLQRGAMALAVAVARRLYASWRQGRAEREAGPPPGELLALRAAALPPKVRCSVPEGYAFYAVYPEAYFAAAGRHPWAAPPLALGLRTIGAGLAAAVAAATGGEAISLRPTGDQFRRRMEVSRRLRARLAAHAGPFAIVDEGPGLSGSSFGAAADLLEELCAPASRIVFMPSHAGPPGRMAEPRHLDRWRRAEREPALLERVVTGDAVASWFADVTGPVERIEDLSAGAWRKDLPAAAWPPAARAQERLKLRLSGPSGRRLARFAGLGAIGEAKLARARLLHAQGFTPAPLALRRGFLLEEWVEGRRPTAEDRAALLAHLGRYLGFRARAFPAPAEAGADLPSMIRMAAFNAELLCGAAIGGRVRERLESLRDARSELAPVHVDGRLQLWEWVQADGRFWKTDALDHSCGHDLIGCQDIAWDVAGAAVELDLSAGELAALHAATAEAAGRPVSLEASSAFRLCYAAFQGGVWSLAEAADPGEGARIGPVRERYAAVLRALTGES